MVALNARRKSDTEAKENIFLIDYSFPTYARSPPSCTSGSHDNSKAVVAEVDVMEGEVTELDMDVVGVGVDVVEWLKWLKWTW